MVILDCYLRVTLVLVPNYLYVLHHLSNVAVILLIAQKIKKKMGEQLLDAKMQVN